MTDPWAFGWTQLLMIAGLLLSGTISFLGLRTFDKWQREKVHEKKLDIAFEALSVAYESEMIFEDIRRRFVREYEWADMPTDRMSKEEIEHSRTMYAIISRMGRHVPFFDRVLVLQPKFMAVFGRESEAIFNKLHRVRHMIQTACDVIIQTPNPRAGTEEWDLVLQMRADIFDLNSSGVKEPHRVTNLLGEFRSDIEGKCAPLVNEEFKGA